MIICLYHLHFLILNLSIHKNKREQRERERERTQLLLLCFCYLALQTCNGSPKKLGVSASFVPMKSTPAVDSDFKSASFGVHEHQMILSGWSKTGGQMGTKAVGGLINSIYRFIHLAACQTVKTLPVQKDYRDMVLALKLLKPVLDDIVNSKIPFDDLLLKEFVELDLAVNEARELMERRGPNMSKICTVLQSGPLLRKVQRSSQEICHLLSRLLQSPACTSHLTCIQHCMQELKSVEQDDRTSELIEEALRDHRDNLVPSTKALIKIVESLSLTSNHELLSESIALEKERQKAELKKNNEEVAHINQMVDLVCNIRDCMFKLEQFEAVNAIAIPPYFRCPLSLELMVDPVIVASGQTYERAFIQKWLDQGLTICPKSRQILSHTNLISNYTVKALITSWCEDNNIRCFSSVGTHNILSHSLSRGPSDDLSRVDSFRGSLQSDITSRSSLDAANGWGSQKVEVSSRSEGELNLAGKPSFDNTNHHLVSNKVTSNWDLFPAKSYNHSRSESISSVISSVDDMLLRESSKCDNVREASAEIVYDRPASSPLNNNLCFSAWLSGSQIHHPKSCELTENGIGMRHRGHSSSFSDLCYDDLTTYSHVQKLVNDLNSQLNDTQTAAAAEIRLLAKHNMENRIIIANSGAITPLVSLLHSAANVIQENAVTALLNLSINDNNKIAIAEAGAIEPLIHILRSGNAEAKQNSAATLFSLSVLEQYKIKIGRSGAVKALVDLLGSGTLRGKKDAATALFNLSIFHENKTRIVQAGAVKYLIELIDPSSGMSDKALALLANLSTVPEGRTAITKEGGIPLLVEAVEIGSQRGKENAASALLQICINSKKFCTLVLQEGAVPPLVALSQSGTPRAKEKAQQILSHFRNQREGSMGKAKS